MLGRIAIGDSEESALAALDRVNFKSLFIEDAAYLKADGGLRADWQTESACVALEIIRPDGTKVLKTTDCFELPEDASNDEFDFDTDAERNLSRAGGCSQSMSDAPFGPYLLLTLVFGFHSLLRRRTLKASRR